MLRVLLVDDEPFILQGIKMLIDWEQEGFEIAGMAANGKEAIAFLEQEEVDLIIADIRMPEMTGLELLETIKREKLSNAYFVILSGYADFEYARRAMQNECTEYLLKPIDREMLLKLSYWKKFIQCEVRIENWIKSEKSRKKLTFPEM